MFVLLSTILGCQPEVKNKVTYFEELDGSNVSGVELLSSATPKDPVARARVVNAFGAAVVSEQEVTFHISGMSEAVTVAVDAFGYASVPLDTGLSSYFYALNAEDEKVNFAYKLPSPPNLGLPIVSDLGAPSPELAVLGTNGYMIAKGNELWWQDSNISATSYTAVKANHPIIGLWSAHIDTDGILDAMLWSKSEVILLRGHPDGGLSWGSAYNFPAGQVVSVAATDLDGDLIADIAIGLSIDKTGAVIILHGNGNWTFTERPPLELDYPLESVVAADENQDGSPDITLIDGETGYIRRYSYGDDGWIGGLPALIDPSAYLPQPGSHLPPMKDVNSDGRLDVILIGGSSNNIQDLVFFVIDGDVTKYEQKYPPFVATFADVDQNNSSDILTLDDDNLHVVQYDAESEPPSFTAKTISGFGQQYPFVSNTIDDDELMDIVVFKEHAAFYFGEDNEQSGWLLSRPTWRNYSTSFIGSFASGDLNEDGNSIELVGFRSNNDRASLEAYRFVADDNGNPTVLEQLNSQTFGTTTSQALDLAQCGSDIITLTQVDDGSHQLQIFNLVNNELTPTAAPLTVGLQQRVACRVINGQLCIALGVGDEWQLRSRELVLADSGADTGWKDVAVGDVEGDGWADVRGCLGDGCNAEMADLNGDGIDEVIAAGEEVIVLSGEQSWTLEKAGDISIVDLDEDGVEELLIREDVELSNPDEDEVSTGEKGAIIWNYRGMNDSLSPPYGLIIDEGSAGFPRLVDVNIDGKPEILIHNQAGELKLSSLSETE